MHTFTHSTCYWCESKQKADQTRDSRCSNKNPSQRVRASNPIQRTNNNQPTQYNPTRQAASQLAKQHKQQQQPRAGSVFAATVLFSNTRWRWTGRYENTPPSEAATVPIRKVFQYSPAFHCLTVSLNVARVLLRESESTLCTHSHTYTHGPWERESESVPSLSFITSLFYLKRKWHNSSSKQQQWRKNMWI